MMLVSFPEIQRLNPRLTSRFTQFDRTGLESPRGRGSPGRTFLSLGGGGGGRLRPTKRRSEVGSTSGFTQFDRTGLWPEVRRGSHFTASLGRT
jgi:hypothetical protein